MHAISKQGKGRHNTGGIAPRCQWKGSRSCSDSRTGSGMSSGPGLRTALVNGALQRPPPATAPRLEQQAPGKEDFNPTGLNPEPSGFT